jgi:Holliday junction resolvasome RuvABC endonuclease subunit
MKRKHDTILALDPGLRDLGYAALDGKELLAAGVLSLRLTKPRRRIGRIQTSLSGWIRAYRPRTLVLEHIPKRPLDSLAGLPALGRRLRRLAARWRIPIAAYSAKTVRRTVLGDGWAGKREVAKALAGRFPDLRVHLTHDRKWKERYWQNMFDAIALALHHQAATKLPSRGR